MPWRTVGTFDPRQTHFPRGNLFRNTDRWDKQHTRTLYRRDVEKLRKDSFRDGLAPEEGDDAIRDGAQVPKLPVSLGDRRPLDKNLDKKCRASKRLKPHHDAIYVVDMEGAQHENFEFCQTLSGRVIPRSTFERSATSGKRQTPTPRFAAQWRTNRQTERS